MHLSTEAFENSSFGGKLIDWSIKNSLHYCSSIFAGEAEAGPPGYGTTCWRAQKVWLHIPISVECIALASIHTIHLIQNRILGVAVLVWLGALLSARALFLCRPSYTAVLCPWQFGGPIRPLCDNANPFFSVVGPTTWNGLPIDIYKEPLKLCLFSIPPLWVGILTGRYINFHWLIERTSNSLRAEYRLELHRDRYSIIATWQNMINNYVYYVCHQGVNITSVGKRPVLFLSGLSRGTKGSK